MYEVGFLSSIKPIPSEILRDCLTGMIMIVGKDNYVTIVHSVLTIVSIHRVIAGVEFDINPKDPSLNTNATKFEFSIIMDTQGEVDNVLMEWNSGRTPLFNFFFALEPRLAGSKVFVVTVSWNIARSNEEKKNGGGEVLVKARSGSTVVDQTTFSITITWAPTSATITPTGSLTIIRGEEMILICASPDKGNPNGTVVWTKDTSIQTEYTNDVLTIDTTETTDGGTWKCSYKNDHGTSTESSYLNVKVVWAPTSATITPTGPLTIIRGEEMTLICASPDKGNPTGTVVWTKDTNIQTEYTKDVLTIDTTETTDGGMWKCSYKNDHGTSTESSYLNVDVIYPASDVTLTLSNLGPFEKGDSLVMTCLNSDPGNPVANLLFTMNGIALTNLEHLNSSTHRINSISNEHNGPLECCYNNDAGETCSDEQTLVVRGEVSTTGVIKLEAANQDVREGDEVTLEYVLTDKGNPQARVTWTHNDTVKSGENNYTFILEDVTFSDSGEYSCYANNSFSKSDVAVYTLIVKPRQGLQVWVYIVIGVCCGILLIVIIVIIICCAKKKKRKDKESDSIGYANRRLQPDNMTGTGPANTPANKPNIEAAAPVYAAVSRGKVLAPIVAGADGSVYSHVDLSKKTPRQSLKGLPMSKKAIDRIIFHKKDGYVNMTFQVRKKFIGDIEIGVCRIGDQSCTSKVSKQHDGASKDVVMVLPIEDSSPDSYSIRIKFTERGQVTQTVDLTYPYNKNAVNVTVLNDVHGTNVSPSYADVEVEGVPPRPSRQGYPAEGVTYAVMDWDRSQAPGRPPRLSSRSPAQEHVVYAHVRPGGNVN